MDGVERLTLQSSPTSCFSTQENECQPHLLLRSEKMRLFQCLTLSLFFFFSFYLAQEQQQLMHSNQAESHTAIDRGTAEQMQLQQQQDCDNPGHGLQLLCPWPNYYQHYLFQLSNKRSQSCQMCDGNTLAYLSVLWVPDAGSNALCYRFPRKVDNCCKALCKHRNRIEILWCWIIRERRVFQNRSKLYPQRSVILEAMSWLP